MPQENPKESLSHIYNAGKLFEPKPVSEETSAPEQVPNPADAPRQRRSVIDVFMPKQGDLIKKKVEAVLRGIEEAEPTSAKATADEGEETKELSDVEVVFGTRQHEIGRDLTKGKKIRVEGDVGDNTGEYMSGGEIYVEKDVEDSTGSYMSGGEIYVKGDAENNTGRAMSGGKIHIDGKVGIFLGNSMTGGEIYIRGDTGHCTGYHMSGGTLRIDGDVASFDETAFTEKNKGTIIWKGKKIWENGSWVAGLNMRLNPFSKNKITTRSGAKFLLT